MSGMLQPKASFRGARKDGSFRHKDKRGRRPRRSDSPDRSSPQLSTADDLEISDERSPTNTSNASPNPDAVQSPTAEQTELSPASILRSRASSGSQRAGRRSRTASFAPEPMLPGGVACGENLIRDRCAVCEMDIQLPYCPVSGRPHQGCPNCGLDAVTTPYCGRTGQQHPQYQRPRQMDSGLSWGAGTSDADWRSPSAMMGSPSRLLAEDLAFAGARMLSSGPSDLASSRPSVSSAAPTDAPSADASPASPVAHLSADRLPGEVQRAFRKLLRQAQALAAPAVVSRTIAAVKMAGGARLFGGDPEVFAKWQTSALHHFVPTEKKKSKKGKKKKGGKRRAGEDDKDKATSDAASDTSQGTVGTKMSKSSAGEKRRGTTMSVTGKRESKGRPSMGHARQRKSHKP